MKMRKVYTKMYYSCRVRYNNNQFHSNYKIDERILKDNFLPNYFQ